MTTRRDFIIGGLCVGTAAASFALTPRHRTSLLDKRVRLEDTIPKIFGNWREVPSDAIVVPQSDNSLAAKLYSQSVGRLYQSSEGEGVMLLIAYGDTQSDQLQLHRPEVCYPAFGFRIIESAAAAINIAVGAVIPGRNLTATSPQRTEQITYWTRLGEYLPQTGNEQRIARVRAALRGDIPDGVLVRISNVEPDTAKAFALNAKFAAALLAAMLPVGRPALIGTSLSAKLRA